MARQRRSDEEIAAARNHILVAALELFKTHGYREVSMRKVAAKAGCSVATIYYYYPHKDALYLDVLKSGFQTLFESLVQSPAATSAPPLAPTSARARVDRLISLFYDFSLKHPTYYDLMFTLPVPKYLDYIGTKMEAAAWDEKQVAVANLGLAADVIREGVAAGEFLPDVDPRHAALAILSVCHGVISLQRSGVLPELDEEFKEAYFRTTGLLIDRLLVNRPAVNRPLGSGSGSSVPS